MCRAVLVAVVVLHQILNGLRAENSHEHGAAKATTMEMGRSVDGILEDPRRCQHHANGSQPLQKLRVTATKKNRKMTETPAK